MWNERLAKILEHIIEPVIFGKLQNINFAKSHAWTCCV